MESPASGRRGPLVPLAAGAAAAALLAPLSRLSIVTLDEGQVMAIGQRLASGQALYRDVHTGIFPGLYWLVEVLLRWCGPDVLATRYAMLAVHAATVALLVGLARALALGPWAAAVAAAYVALVVVSFPVLTMLTYSPLSMMFALAAVAAALRFAARGEARFGLLCGAFVALATLAKQNFGVFAAASIAFSLAWTVRSRDGGRHASPWRMAGLPVLGGLAVAALAVARLAAEGALAPFVSSAVLGLLHSQMETFRQPIPPLFGAQPPDGPFLFLYGPGALVSKMLEGDGVVSVRTVWTAVKLGYATALASVAAVPILAAVFVRGEDASVRTAARFALPLAAAMFAGLFPSAIWSHLAVVFPPLLLVAACTADLAVRRCGQALRTGLAAGSALGLLGLAAWLGVGLEARYRTPLGLGSPGLLVTAADAAMYGEATQFLRSCAGEGEAVFVTPSMPLLYVTSGRPNATRFDLLIAHDVDEGEALRAIDAAGVRCVVRDAGRHPQFPPFASVFPGLARMMDEEFERVGGVAEGGQAWDFLRRREGRPTG